MRVIVLALAATTLVACGSSSTSPPGNAPSTTPPSGGVAWEPSADITLDQLFSDKGALYVLSEDTQSFTLTNLFPTPQRPIFTTPMAGGLGFAQANLDVVVAAGNAFYTSQGALHAVSTADGTDRILGTPGNCIPRYADATMVFCALGGKVLSFSSAPGAAPIPADAGSDDTDGGVDGGIEAGGTVVADLGTLIAYDIVVDDTTVYIASGTASIGGTGLWSVPRSGGTPTQLMSASTEDTVISLLESQSDATYLYFQTNSTILRMSKSTHRVDTLFPICGNLQIVGTYLYYGCSDMLYRTPLGTMSGDGGFVGTPIAEGQGESEVVVGSEVYWLDYFAMPFQEYVASLPLPQ